MNKSREKLIEATNEVTGCIIQSLTDLDTIKSMRSEDLKLIQSFLHLIEAANEYIDSSSKMLETIDLKLDDINSKLMKKES